MSRSQQPPQPPQEEQPPHATPTFEEAVKRVLNAPPMPEQQARKDASKAKQQARQAERKTHQHPSGDKDAPTK